MTDDTPRPVAVVSGGSRGIGRAVVTHLARDGFDVAFCYKSDTDAAERAAKEAAAFGTRVVAHRVDVADADAARAFIDTVETDLGPVHALVTSAGVVSDNPLVLMRNDQWRDVIATNLDGTYNLCRAVVYSLIKRRAGTIVTLSSVAGVSGNASQSNYAAAKAGIIGLTRSLAKELGRYGIRANSVAPGPIETDMTAGLGDETRRRILGQVPLGRFGTAEEVADLVSFLISDRAAYISGQVLGIDGGLII
jgi:3-oxoacyl-[acyl-carrier protein] reductase